MEGKEILQTYEDVSILDVIDEMIVIVDPSTRKLLYANKKACAVMGVAGDEYKGMLCYEFMRRNGFPCPECELSSGSRAGKVKWRTYNGHTQQTFEVSGRDIVYRGKPAHLEIGVDISEQLRSKSSLQTALAFEMALSEAINILYSKSDMSKAIGDMLNFLGGYLQAERVFFYGKKGDEYVPVHRWNNEGACSAEDMDGLIDFTRTAHLQDKAFARHEPYIVDDVRKLRQDYPMESRMFLEAGIYNFLRVPVFIKNEYVGFFGMDNLVEFQIQNLTSMLRTLSYFVSASLLTDRNKQLLERLSYVDAMTGVENRNAFIREQQKLSSSRQPVGVIFFDLNGLKQTNDTMGHTAGDKLIISLARAIGKLFRQREIFRTGGDEFVVICVGIPERLFTERVKKVREQFAAAGSPEVSIGSSWGDCASRLDEVMAQADAEMYEYKRHFHGGTDDLERAINEPE